VNYFVYDTKENCILAYLHEGFQYYAYHNYKYDYKGNIKEHSYQEFDYEFKKTFYNSQYFYRYDTSNNVIEENHYKDNTHHYTKIYTYIYDEKGNWIKRISFQNDEQREYAIRKIEYY